MTAEQEQLRSKAIERALTLDRCIETRLMQDGAVRALAPLLARRPNLHGGGGEVITTAAPGPLQLDTSFVPTSVLDAALQVCDATPARNSGATVLQWWQSFPRRAFTVPPLLQSTPKVRAFYAGVRRREYARDPSLASTALAKQIKDLEVMVSTLRGEGEGCGCGWATAETCAADDGSACNWACCRTFREGCGCGWATAKTCAVEDGSECNRVCCRTFREGCGCDWATAEACKVEDGSACNRACCRKFQEGGCGCAWATAETCAVDDGTACHRTCCRKIQ